ncbi:MAG: hypothetical protein ABI615_10895 [Chthoniobacterales bacterium]
MKNALYPNRIAQVIFFCLMGKMSVAAVTVDVKRPPLPAVKQELLNVGWSDARDQISVALCKGYQPSRFSLAGSTQDVAFVSWINLWQWFNLFSESQKELFGHYIRQHLVIDADGKLTTLGAGVEIPAGFKFLTDEEWRKVSGEAFAIAGERFGIDVSQASMSAGDLVGKDFAQVLIGNDAFSREFFETLSEQDNVPGVLQNLKTLWEKRPAQFVAYQNLALALAVVFDQPAPPRWPHSQVDPRKIPSEALSIVDRFDFWVASNEARRTLTDLRKLDALQLKFVVDALVSRTELEWAQKNIRFPASDFGRAFTSIRYDQNRIRSKQYQWTGPEYTLAAIRQQGGICVDQAYFAMLGGKALGLPTLFFTGQGSDGGHAWLGYMKNDNRWDLDCGRYINQNYAAGEAFDPQTWLPISDHELSYLAARFRNTPAFFASYNELVMAEIAEKAGDKMLEAKALDGAIAVCPAYAEAWQAKTDYLYRTAADPKAIKAHLEAGLRQFSNNEDVRTSYQKNLAALARSQGDEAAATAYEAKIVQQNRRRRSDISVAASAEKLPKLLALIKEKKFDDAYTQYHSLFLQIGNQGGGNFYYEIVKPFVNALIETGDVRGAKRAIDLAERSLRPEMGSILAQELGGLEAKVKAAGGR